MSDLMNKILAAKAQLRRELAALPFEQKIALVEKMRDRSLLMASSPLRRPIKAGQRRGLPKIERDL